MPPQLLFDKNAKTEVLSLLNKDVDNDGYIVEKTNPVQKVLTFDGEEIMLKDFGGLEKGSELFIKDNLVSLLKLTKR